MYAWQLGNPTINKIALGLGKNRAFGQGTCRCQRTSVYDDELLIQTIIQGSGEIFPQYHFSHFVHGRRNNVKAAAEMPTRRADAHITCQTEY